jgi:hypothetical protein
MDSGWPESADQRNVSTGEKKEADAVLGVAPKTADFVKDRYVRDPIQPAGGLKDSR